MCSWVGGKNTNVTGNVAPILPINRHALLRARHAGATTEELARAAGWPLVRVERELAAAQAQLDAVAATRSAGDRPRSNGDVPGRKTPERRPASDVSLPDRPRLAEAVQIESPPPAGEHRVVHDPRSGRYLRVKLPQAAFLEGLDGTRTVPQLVAQMVAQTDRIPGSMVVPLLARFAALGLLEGAEPTRPKAGGSLVIKLATVDPGPVLDRVASLLRPLARPAVLVLAAAVAVSGLVSLAVHMPAGLLHSHHLRQPLFVTSALVAVLLTTMLHELGHAGAVVVLGGRVRRMGLMLFYLLPAMFCDTTDAWRFPYRWQRVAVALSGLAVQLTITGLVAQLLWFVPGPGAQAWIALYALANIGMSAYNLIPLVKLDGYWALAAALDRPNLRSEAMARARQGVRGPGLGLALFGAACAAFGPLLLLYALLRWEHVLVGLGWVGALAWFVLLIAVAVPAIRAAARAPRLPLAVGLAAAVAALILVPASPRRRDGFARAPRLGRRAGAPAACAGALGQPLTRG